MPDDKRRITWLQFYLAAKHGDPAIVHRALQQGLEFRPSADLHVDVMATAVAQDHWPVVKTFLDFMESQLPDRASVSTRAILVRQNLPLVIRSGTSELLKHFLSTLTNLHEQMSKQSLAESKQMFKNVLAECVESCSLPIFKQLERFVRLDQKWHRNVLLKAFNNGRAGLFEHIMLSSHLTLSKAEKLTGIQEFFLAIAIDQGFDDDYLQDEDYFKNKKISYLMAGSVNWHLPLIPLYDKSRCVRGPDSAFAVAARFGKLKLLKLLHEECKDNINEHDWSLICRDMYREAVRFGHKNVVKYLLRRPKNDPRLYISLESHLDEQYPLIPEHMYKLLLENYVQILQQRNKSKGVMARIGHCLSSELERKMKSGHESPALVIVRNFSHLLGPQRLDLALVNAVKYRSLGVVLYLRTQLRLLCPFTSLGHQAIGAALTPVCKRAQKLPCPVILETLLDTIPMSGSTCPCGELVPMDFYLHFDFYRISKDIDKFDFRQALRNSQSLLKILAVKKLVPRALTLKKVFRLFFSRCETLNYIATRLICLADWLDLLAIYRLEILGSGKWFQVDYPDRDQFLFHILRSMCGTTNSTLRWNGLTSYIASTPERREQYTDLIHQLGLKVQYTIRHHDSDSVVRVNAQLAKASLLPLQSLCRTRIYSLAREKSTTAFRNGDYLPLSRVISDVCSEFFPHLRFFMEFRG